MPNPDLLAPMPTRPRNPWTDAEVERHWDAVAPIYRRENERVREAHVQRFHVAVEALALFPGARVLNVSSRDAEAEEHLKRACPVVELVHAELSQGLLDVGRALYPQAAQCKLKSYSHLPWANAGFDRVLSLETLEHVADPPAFLSELRRVVRPAGRLVLSCPPATAEGSYRLYTALCGGHGEGPHRFLASREVTALLEETGCDLRKHWGTLLLPVGPPWLRAAAERLITRFPTGRIAEWGIRQFYVAQAA